MFYAYIIMMVKIRLKTSVKKTFDWRHVLNQNEFKECLQDIWRYMSILTKKIFIKIVHVWVTSLSFSNSQSFLRENLDILFNFFLSAEMKPVVWKEFMVTYFFAKGVGRKLGYSITKTLTIVEGQGEFWRLTFCLLIFEPACQSVGFCACLPACLPVCPSVCLSV